MAGRQSHHMEFAQSRREILKRAGRESLAYGGGSDEEKKYAWEIELEQYRSRKRLDRFLIFGSICGILSLAGTVYLYFTLMF